ncbi:MAG: Uncharacterised protein [Acidimicrobiales bacterium AG-410-I20]|nr:MAG: Uncharacterised protein [Acidimicrobiales bacterium AG-410-I20]
MRSHPWAGTIEVSGPSGVTVNDHWGALVTSSSRSHSVCKLGNLSCLAPHVSASAVTRSVSSARRSEIRSLKRLGSTTTTRPSSPMKSKRTFSFGVSQGSHDSIPSNISPFAKRSHCSLPHGSLPIRLSACFLISSVGRSSLQGKILTASCSAVERWLEILNSVNLSMTSPQRSSRIGVSYVEGHISTIEPLTANSPRCST